MITQDETIQTHEGIILHKVRRYETDCYIHTINLKIVPMKLTYGFRSVTDACKQNKASLSFNGGGWGLWLNKSLPNEYLVIDGVWKQSKSFDGRPCITTSKTGVPMGGLVEVRNRPVSSDYNAWGFDRIIAKDKIWNTRIYDNSTAPRTISGVDDNGHLIILVCEGRTIGQKGLTFKECYNVMLEFRARSFGANDGGYSSCAVNTYFDNPLLNNSYTVEYRRTVHQVLFFPKDGKTWGGEEPETPNTGGVTGNYEYVSPYSMSVRKEHTTKSEKIGGIIPNTKTSGNEFFEAFSNDELGRWIKGDSWMKVNSGGWVAIRVNNFTYGTCTKLS